MTESSARAWAEGTDQRNAEVIELARDRADLIITDFGANSGDTAAGVPVAEG